MCWQYFSILTAILPGEPGLAGLLELRTMEVVVTTGAIKIRAKLQWNRHHQQCRRRICHTVVSRSAADCDWIFVTAGVLLLSWQWWHHSGDTDAEGSRQRLHADSHRQSLSRTERSRRADDGPCRRPPAGRGTLNMFGSQPMPSLQWCRWLGIRNHIWPANHVTAVILECYDRAEVHNVLVLELGHQVSDFGRVWSGHGLVWQTFR